MENICKKALSLKFDDDELIKSLIIIIEATPNPIVATEIMLGIYEEVEIEILKEEVNDYRNICNVSYDPFKEEVSFDAEDVKFTEGWVLKTLENPKLEDIESDEWSADSVAISLGIKREVVEANYKKVSIRDGFKPSKSHTMSLRMWERMQR